jgi:hypothetical protein
MLELALVGLLVCIVVVIATWTFAVSPPERSGRETREKVSGIVIREGICHCKKCDCRVSAAYDHCVECDSPLNWYF